jgi:hypothetical protein
MLSIVIEELAYIIEKAPEFDAGIWLPRRR